MQSPEMGILGGVSNYIWWVYIVWLSANITIITVNRTFIL